MKTSTRANQTQIVLAQGDITHETTEAIVNAANSSLMGGGGVDGAIHRAAGPRLLATTAQLGGCPTGDARITPGYNLPAKHIIHAVGPVYRYGDPAVAEALRSAYRRSLEVAVENDITTMAFPSISTGAYGYPVDEAAPIALAAVADFATAQSALQLVRFILFDAETLAGYAAALADLVDKRGLERDV
jgi:O-acetyl-ADP-ribose deacetylase (regulator of RNase III)